MTQEEIDAEEWLREGVKRHLAKLTGMEDPVAELARLRARIVELETAINDKHTAENEVYAACRDDVVITDTARLSAIVKKSNDAANRLWDLWRETIAPRTEAVT